MNEKSKTSIYTNITVSKILNLFKEKDKFNLRKEISFSDFTQARRELINSLNRALTERGVKTLLPQTQPLQNKNEAEYKAFTASISNNANEIAEQFTEKLEDKSISLILGAGLIKNNAVKIKENIESFKNNNKTLSFNDNFPEIVYLANDLQKIVNKCKQSKLQRTNTAPLNEKEPTEQKPEGVLHLFKKANTTLSDATENSSHNTSIQEDKPIIEPTNKVDKNQNSSKNKPAFIAPSKEEIARKVLGVEPDGNISLANMGSFCGIGTRLDINEIKIAEQEDGSKIVTLTNPFGIGNGLNEQNLKNIATIKGLENLPSIKIEDDKGIFEKRYTITLSKKDGNEELKSR